MFVGVCRVSFHLRGNNSLKGKRKVVRSILDRTRSKFNASIAEVQDNDEKKRAVIGIAVVGNAPRHVDSMLGRIGSFIEGLGLAPVSSRETEIIPMGGEIGIGNDYDDQWSPPGDDADNWTEEGER